MTDNTTAFNFCNPFDHILPFADGAISAQDRGHLWGMYIVDIDAILLANVAGRNPTLDTIAGANPEIDLIVGANPELTDVTGKP